MNLNRIVLGSAGMGVAAIGATYLVAPQALLDVYGVDIQSASEANLLRGVCGGLFLAFALVFWLGALKPHLARSAQVALLAFMGGAAVGRLVSMVVDGRPHFLLVAVFFVEVVYSGAAVFLLRAETNRAQPSAVRATTL